MANRTYIILGVVVLVLLIVMGGGLWWYYRNKQDIKVEIRPKTVSVANGKTIKFTTGNVKVTWSVSDTALGNINADCIFTAKGNTGSVTVTATSVDDVTKKDTATVTLISDSGNGGPGTTNVIITPSNAIVPFQATQQLTANIPVNWSVDNSSMESIDANGLFTAKAGTGSATITAVSRVDSSRKSTATIQLIPYAGPSGLTCVGGEFKRCVKMGPTISPELTTPFEVMCSNGEYVESLSGAGGKATHGIGIKCTGSGGEQYFGSRNGNYYEKIGWKNGKPPEGGYQRLEPWYGQQWNSVGRLNIYDKKGELYYLGAQTDNPRTDMNCGNDGVISGVFGTTNGELINTIGVRCSYKN